MYKYGYYNGNNILFQRSSIVQSVLDNFPNSLTSGEAGKIEKIVDTMVSSGNWDQIDYFFGWFLSDEANALTSWKGIKTATNVNSAVFDSKGVLTNGSNSYIDTNIVLSTDLINAILNDTHIDSFCYDNLDTSNGKYLFGVSTTDVLQINQNPTLSRFVFNVNSATTSRFNDGVGLFQDKTRYSIGRDDSINQEMFINGVQVDTEGDVSTGLSTKSITIGALQAGIVQLHLNAKQSYFLIGGGFDLVALNNELNLVQTLFNLNI